MRREMNMDNLTSLEGKEIRALLWMQEYYYLCLDDDLSLQISNCEGFWRLIQNGTIVASSVDFFAKSNSTSPEPEYWPARIAHASDEMDADIFDEDEYLECMYERLEESTDQIVKKMMELLEYMSICELKTTDLGDLSLKLSNGVTLEIIASCPANYRKIAPYKLLLD